MGRKKKKKKKAYGHLEREVKKFDLAVGWKKKKECKGCLEERHKRLRQVICRLVLGWVTDGRLQ